MGYPFPDTPHNVMTLPVPDWLCLDPCVSEHMLKLLLCERRDAQRLRLGQLAASIFTHNQVVRLFTDGTGGPGTQAQQFHLDPVTGVVLQLTGSHNGLAGKGLFCTSGIMLSSFKNVMCFRAGRQRLASLASLYQL